MSVSTAPNGSTSPHIRIAYLYHNDQPFTPMRHMAAHLGAASNRTFLPDYEITIDAFPIEPHVADAPVGVARILEDDTPTYHAIAGPWSREDAKSIVDVAATVRILHVHKGDNPELSNRNRYPYTFRVLRAIQGIMSSWFHICGENGWRAVAGFWAEEDTYSTSNELAGDYNITNYPTLMENGQADWAAEAAELELVKLIRSTRLRVVMTYIDLPQGWRLFCRVYRAQLQGIQWFVSPGYGNGWFFYVFPHLGDCTADDMYRAVAGHLLVLHTPASPGVFFLGAVYIPPIGGDFSQVPLTCMPHLTAHDYFNNGEHLMQAFMEGAVTDIPSATVYIANSGSEQDQVCAILLALHDVIYNKGFSAESIERREKAAFHALVKSTENVNFFGPTGWFRFTGNNTGDPEYIYYMLSQQALPERSNFTSEVAGIVTFPDGPHGKPLIQELITLQWQDGSSSLGPNKAGLFPDCGAENAVLLWDYCVPCPPGTSYDALLGDCRTCPLGQYQNESAAASCIAATPGWYVENTTHPLAPSLCPLGHECPQASMILPQPCSPGRFAGRLGQAECELCPAGRYQQTPKGTACAACEHVAAGSTTANIASTSPQECICPLGRYRPMGANYCAACLTGLTCPQGSDMRNLNSSAFHLYPGEEFLQFPYPVAQPGYMTLLSAPVEVYLCSKERHCPGGPPGFCDHLRDSSAIACGDCAEDAYETGDECLSCEGSSAALIVAAGIAAVVLVVIATILVNRDVHKTPAASLMIVAISGLLFTSVQALGVFNQMTIPWEEPMKSILELTQVLSFDLKLLKVTCVVGSNPIRSFALRQLVALVAVPFIWFTLLLKKYTPRVGHRRVRVAVELSNSIGTLYSIFFISIVISAMDPFICYEHPDGWAESVRSAPSLLCFEGGDHTTMIVIGSLAMCTIPLPFLCLCMYGIVMYARSVTSHSSQSFLHALRFLFFRYTPERYYFQVVMLLRSLLLCLVPALFRGQSSTQVLCMCVVLACYTLLVEELRPWRSKACTPLDAIMTLLLLLLLLCGALFLEDTPQKAVISVLSLILLVAIIGSAAVLLAYAIWRRFVPRPYYEFFLCHHKAHAAAQARYLKNLLLARSRRRGLEVFIDSDNLQELDSLFDIVKSRVRHLVVYLTSETLKRPWCAGEVVTAVRGRLLITRLQTPSFTAPSEEQYNNPEAYLDNIGCNLREYGIQFKDITEAFKHFLSAQIPYLDLNVSAAGTRRFELAAAVLLKQRQADVKTPSVEDVLPGSVLIATNALSDEANASGGILASRISEAVFRVCETGVVLLADYGLDSPKALRIAKDAVAVVVLLTPGCLQSLDLVHLICMLMHEQGNGTAPLPISVNTPGFEFPPQAQIQAIGTSDPSLDVSYAGKAADHIKAFFKVISIVLPTHASQQAIGTQADEVYRRIHVHLKGKKGHPSGDNVSIPFARMASFHKKPSNRWSSGTSGNRVSSKTAGSTTPVSVTEEPKDGFDNPFSNGKSPDTSMDPAISGNTSVGERWSDYV